MITFGPIPSRRLGRSLGINNIPPKSYSYSCVYCQVGPTREREIEPRGFYSPETILSDVEERLDALEQAVEEAGFACGAGLTNPIDALHLVEIVNELAFLIGSRISSGYEDHRRCRTGILLYFDLIQFLLAQGDEY